MSDFKYSNLSLQRLYTCHEDLITICSLALQVSPVDITVVCGFRDWRAQNDAFTTGHSRVPWPQSTHNRKPSDAVDLAPYFHGGIQWNAVKELHLIAGLVVGIGAAQNVQIRWGGAWNGMMNAPWQFNDLYHFERIV